MDEILAAERYKRQMSIRLIKPFGLALRLDTTASEIDRLISDGAFPVLELPGGNERIDPVDTRD